MRGEAATQKLRLDDLWCTQQGLRGVCSEIAPVDLVATLSYALFMFF
jgi:hypothetical protein